MTASFVFIQARYIHVVCSAKIYFDKLPFALNKGEGLLVEIKGIPQNLVFKKGMSLCPTVKIFSGLDHL
jgi:hypothetical protein